eukprot:CAMPEP_0117561554 /NCGR_PEP_ID=MMETSP0784-20121206/54480_1 /TAXON_ID=39447 /ORGANISM="" /LENGTH=64 /DNA_ID=CAMNT_0005359055 /DNA_START=233 /DNA_END=423 /DNA_ORIENTATION=+
MSQSVARHNKSTLAFNLATTFLSVTSPIIAVSAMEAMKCERKDLRDCCPGTVSDVKLHGRLLEP